MIRDKKDLDAFVSRMTEGRTKAAAGRASSTAPPKAAPAKSKNTDIPQKSKAAGNASPVAMMPTPATRKSTNKKGGEQTAATKTITINIR